MARWKISTPCDLALDGKDHKPHEHTVDDEVYWCAGEGFEHTPIEDAGLTWLDEVDWSKVDWDKVVAAQNARYMSEALVPEERGSVYERLEEWCYYASAIKFYSALIGVGAALIGLMWIAYCLYWRI